MPVLRRYIIEDTYPIPPFNQPARDLTIGTLPLGLHQETLFSEYFADKNARMRRTADHITLELGPPLSGREGVQYINEPALVYRDSLWFDEEFFDDFMSRAERLGRACRAAIPADDMAYRTYTLKLAKNFEKFVDVDGTEMYLVDLWYLPNGYESQLTPIPVASGYREKGFYSVPDFMATDQDDLTHFLPQRALLSIESWVHIYFASVIFGVFTRASRLDDYIEGHNLYALKLLWHAVLEQKQILNTSPVVKIGRGTTIHPTAIITGPATIGDNCTIGPGAVIDNATIGDNCTIDSGCVVALSTLANNCFLPFKASVYLTAIMENTIIAQNTCLQMCVIGRNSFVGAGSTFTDFNLIGQVEYDDQGRAVRTIPRPIAAANRDGKIEDVGQTVMGGAVGHNCRLGAGLVVFPGRMIESDVVLFASPQRRVISRSITFEESDHHYVRGGSEAHRRIYPRPDEIDDEVEESWETW